MAMGLSTTSLAQSLGEITLIVADEKRTISVWSSRETGAAAKADRPSTTRRVISMILTQSLW